MKSKSNYLLFVIFLFCFFSLSKPLCSQEASKEIQRDDILIRALAKLAKSADLHESLQYEIQCVEEVKRMVHRTKESAASFGFLPHETMNLKHGILIMRDENGIPLETRLKLDRKGRIKLSKKGIPKEVELPPQFQPIAEAYPHSQMAWFTTHHQKNLKFQLLSEEDKKESQFLIQCANPDELAIEFFDREPPVMHRPLPEGYCTARASGQLCLNPKSGEVSQINFYRLQPTEKGCLWDLSHPFAVIEQNVIEEKTGARFPSKVETMVPLDWRDIAIFTQLFVDCVFIEVKVTEKIQGIKSGD